MIRRVTIKEFTDLPELLLMMVEQLEAKEKAEKTAEQAAEETQE